MVIVSRVTYYGENANFVRSNFTNFRVVIDFIEETLHSVDLDDSTLVIFAIMDSMPSVPFAIYLVMVDTRAENLIHLTEVTKKVLRHNFYHYSFIMDDVSGVAYAGLLDQKHNIADIASFASMVQDRVSANLSIAFSGRYYMAIDDFTNNGTYVITYLVDDAFLNDPIDDAIYGSNPYIILVSIEVKIVDMANGN